MSPVQSPNYDPPRKDRIIFVEGRHDKGVVESICRQEGLDDVIQVITYAQFGKLGKFFDVFIRDPNFEVVNHIGLTKDSDTGADRVLQSLRDAWNRAGVTLQKVGSRKLQCSFFAVPDNKVAGRMEHLCLRSPIFPRILKCAKLVYLCAKHVANYRMDREKSLVAAYLSLMKEPGLPLERAAEAGYWDLRSEAFRSFRKFVVSVGK